VASVRLGKDFFILGSTVLGMLRSPDWLQPKGAPFLLLATRITPNASRTLAMIFATELLGMFRDWSIQPVAQKHMNPK